MSTRPRPIYPNPDCMCSKEYPVFDYGDPTLCLGLVGGGENILRSRIEMPADSYFFSKDFINDNDEVS